MDTSLHLALFDFDGTITTDDSLIKFIRFVVGDAKFIWGITFLFPMLTAYKLKFIPNYKANRVQELYNLDDYKHIYAYGDSRGDKEL